MLRYITLILFSYSFIPIVLANDYGANVTEERFKKADVVIVQMNDIRAAVFTFYDDNSALPGNMGLLTDPAMIYYTGNIRSAFGTNFVGAISGDGRFFNVTVDLRSADIASYVAQRLNTQPTGTSVTLSIGSPASSIVDNGFLARNFDPARPLLNEMNTNLSMGGNDVNNVGVINGSRINLSDLATVEDLLVIGKTTTLDFEATGTSTLANANVVGNAVLNTTTSNGAMSVNGGLNVNSIATFNDVANFSGAANIHGALTASDGLSVVNGIDTDSIEGNGATFVTTNTTDLISTGTTTLNTVEANRVTVDDLVVNGTINLNDSLITGDQVVQGKTTTNELDVTNNAIIRNNLTVNGQTDLDDLIVAGNTIAHGDFTAVAGVLLGNGNTHIGQSTRNESLRVVSTAGWVDIGRDISGMVTFETDANGYTFDHKVKATGSGGSIELNVSSGLPEIVFSRLGNDVTFGLTDPSTISLSGANFRTNKDVYARQLYENNVALSDKYLGKNDKASDSDKLDGYSSEDFSLVGHKHNRLEGTTYQNLNLNVIASSVPSGALQVDQYTLSSTGRPAGTNNANSVLTVGQHNGGYTAQLAFSSDGQMYQRSNPSTSLGTWGKVWTSTNDGINSDLDAGKLGGKHSSLYAATDISNVFSQQQTFNGGIKTNGSANYLYGKNELSAGQYDASGSKARYAIDLNDSDMVGVKSIHFKSSANSLYEGLLFPRSSSASNLSQYSSLRSYSGSLFFNPIANSTTYKITDGVNLYEGNVALSSKYLSKNDNSVMRLSKSRSGSSAAPYYGMYAGSSDLVWIRAPKYGLLPWENGVGNIGASSWNFRAVYAQTLYENNVALSTKYLSKSGTAANSSKLGGYTATQFIRKNTDIAVIKSNAWLSLDSPSSGSSAYTQGAGISIGESGKKGSHALHLTYTGDGNSYIGMGTVSTSTGKPANAVLKMNYASKNAWFLGDIYEKGVKLEDKYELKGGGGSAWTNAYNGAESRSFYLASQHALAGKEVIVVVSDYTDDDEISYFKTYIPVQSGFTRLRFFNKSWGQFEYTYSNRKVYQGGDVGIRQIWYRDPVDLPPIGTIRR